MEEAMANEEQLAILLEGVEAWNKWRTDLRAKTTLVEFVARIEYNPIDLSGALLSETDLAEADFTGVNLRGADLSLAYLHGAQLEEANLIGANLQGARLGMANLRSAFLDNTLDSSRKCNFESSQKE